MLSRDEFSRALDPLGLRLYPRRMRGGQNGRKWGAGEPVLFYYLNPLSGAPQGGAVTAGEYVYLAIMQ